MIPYKDIEKAEQLESPLSTDMANALDLWYKMYLDQAPWIDDDSVFSLNLASLCCSEIARQTLLEMKWNISGPVKEGAVEEEESERAQYLHDEFEKLIKNLRTKLEQGCASGGMTVKPYVKDGHIFFDWTMAWSLYPVSFGDDGELTDCIFRDTFIKGKTIYTRLERHTVEGTDVKITQRAFKSETKENLGTEIPLAEVPQWEGLQPEAIVKDSEGQMFGWYKTPNANNIDIDCPMGVSVFSKAAKTIKQADKQYSRLLWEYEGSELAVDVDPTALKPKPNGAGGMEVPQLNKRLFRGVDLGEDDTYRVFNPPIRDASILAGLNQLLIRIEDQVGLARGTLADPNQEVKTATELRINKQRSYSTIKDNQDALEQCLRDVVRAMDKYATLYNLAPAGEYEVSFEWDDSIITDTAAQLKERLELYAQGMSGKVEMRQWYFGETEAQAQAAIQKIKEEEPNIKDLIPDKSDDDYDYDDDDQQKVNGEKGKQK